MKLWTRGFTLIEVMIVLAVIGILSSVLYSNFNESTSLSRDVQRKADLTNLQNAIELYKNKNGRYPEACNGPTLDHNGLIMSGHSGVYECPSDNEYIVGLAPEYIPTLPIDPKLAGSNSGYVYAVNNTGSAYKVMALDTVEGEVVGQDHDFFRCDSSWPLSFYVPHANNTTLLDPAICAHSRNNTSGSWNSGKTTFPECTTPGTFNNDYALSGGYSNDRTVIPGLPEKGYEYDTDIVRCK